MFIQIDVNEWINLDQIVRIEYNADEGIMQLWDFRLTSGSFKCTNLDCITKILDYLSANGEAANND